MRHHVFIILLFISLLPLQSIGQKFSFKESKLNTTQKSYKNILIIGSGRVENRAFLDELTGNVINSVGSDSIKWEYQYLGRSTTQANRQIKELLKGNFDAVLVFSPTDSLPGYYVSYSKPVYSNSPLTPTSGYPQFSAPTRKIEFTSDFTIQIFDSQNQEISIWESNLYVNCDVSKKKVYLDISKKLISSLKANKIIN
jgi:hypothetical protein